MPKYAEEILAAVTELQQHPKAEQVFLEMKREHPSIALGTVYLPPCREQEKTILWRRSIMNANVSLLLNEQINKEFYSAYLYLDFANYYAAVGLDGFENWYRVQAQEERDHAMLMVQYGDRRMLFAGDNENRSQQYFAANPPEIGLNADIFKYPHHGQVRLRDDFLEAINPQLIFINGAANVIKGSVNYCDKKHISYLLGYKGLTRMRTDGNIWVIDYLKEKNADRDLPYTPERDE